MAEPIEPAASEADKVQAVLIWLLDGQSEHSIREAIEGNWPGEDSEPLLLKALQATEDGAAKTRERIEAWAILATQHIYTKSVAIGEYAIALRSITQLKELASEPVETKQASQNKPAKTSGLKPNGLRIRAG